MESGFLQQLEEHERRLDAFEKRLHDLEAKEAAQAKARKEKSDAAFVDSVKRLSDR